MEFPARFRGARNGSSGSATTEPATTAPAATGPVGIAINLVAGAVLALGAADVLPVPLAVALAGGVPATVVGFRLIRLALRIHGAQHSFGPCRGAGFLGVAVVAGGLSALMPAAAGAGAGAGAGGQSGLPAVIDPAGGRLLLCVGLLTTAGLYLLGLFLLPGVATTTGARARRGLDGLSIAASLSLVSWLALPAREPAPPTVAVIAVLAGVGGISIITVVAVRAARYRRAALLCGAGAGLSVLGLAVLAVLSAYPAPALALLGPTLAVAVGPSVVWAGAVRAGTGPVAVAPADADGAALAGYPLLTVPVSLAVLAAAVHLVRVGQFDATAIVLGLSAVSLLLLREALATTDVRRYARRLAHQEAHFRSLVAGAHDLILVLNPDLLVAWQSPAAARLFGLADADVLGRPFADLLHPQDAPGAVSLLTGVLAGGAPAGGTTPVLLGARLRDGFGQWRETESTVGDQRDVPEVAALVLHVRDVGDRRRLERALHRMAGTDQLTGLSNRRELLRTLVAQRGTAKRPGALLAADLHNVDGVVQQRGREMADAIVVEAARRIRGIAGPDDVAARLGGPTFALLTLAGPVAAYALGARLLAELSRPYELPGATLVLRVSVGLAELGDSPSADDVLSRADLARRRARQLGGDRIEWYDACLEDQLNRRMDLERELAGALGRGEFDLVFQPVVHLVDRRPAGAEALLRWRHPALGTVAPTEFVPVAEELGVIGAIGDWVLDTACRHLASWLPGRRNLWMSVNVSPHQLSTPDFVSRVRGVLAAHRVAPDRLIVELPQSRLTTDLPVVITQLAALRAIGVRVALDDFGTGQASLAQLRRLPVDMLKLNLALVGEPVPASAPGRPLMDVVVELGRRLGLDLVAEGLATPEQLAEAVAAGCGLGQGQVLGRPVPAEHIEAYLEDHRTPSL